ncbi:TPA: hypothetical protein ACX3E3_005358 [Vibrio parahaemolyticus]|nr:hypothetical protein [Vibrio parahaemolyticus]HCH2104992.1 hypothetical protein [Vibrio parahaemolyticus]
MSNRTEFETFYNEFRNLELNKDYYAERAEQAKKKLRRIDIALAITGLISVVSGYGFWQTKVGDFPLGPILLAIGLVIGAVLGAVRPYLKLEDEHARLSNMAGSYMAIAHVMQDVISDLKIEQNISESSRAIYRSLRQVKGSLSQNEDSPSDKELIKKLQDAVNRRHPPKSFYYPKDSE